MPNRVIYVPYRDERGRLFHRRTEDNDGIPGAYRAMHVNGAWVALGIGGRDAPESPTWLAGPVPTFWAIDHLGGIGMSALFPDGWRWDEAQVRALQARHAGDRLCSRCEAGVDLATATLDARTVVEAVYCATCCHRVHDAMIRALPQYREVECRCGVMCYEQMRPAPRGRGEWNDVLPCPKCGRLACAECLGEGAASCRGCVKVRRRRAA